MKQWLTRIVSSTTVTRHDCGVEQLAARRAHNPEVTGSSPVPAIYAKLSTDNYLVACAFLLDMIDFTKL